MDVQEEEESGEKEPSPLIPRVIYQRALVDLNFEAESMSCSTTLLLAFPQDDLREGSEFHLHCRVPVESVVINNLPAEFDLRDPLRCIHYSEERRENYVGKEAEVNFRSALEVSSQGELLLKIPQGFEANRKSLDPIPLLPVPTQPNLAAVFGTLDDIITASFNDAPSNMDVDGEKKGEEGSEDLMNVGHGRQDEEKGFSHKNVIVQVTIAYTLKTDEKHVNKGFVYRRNMGSSGESKERGDIACAYTIGAGGDSPITDYDGVRCWLPCVDTPDQRAVYDITIRAPSDCVVASCGRRVSSVDEGEAEDGTWESKSSRFVTGRRLPAYSVGFFVGRAEEYRLPLYRTSGRALVALGLADTVTSSPYERQRALKASVEGGDFSAANGSVSQEGTSFEGGTQVGLSDVKVELVRANYAGDNGSSADGAGEAPAGGGATTGRRRSVSFSAPSSSSSATGEPSKKRVRVDPGSEIGDDEEEGGESNKDPAAPPSAIKAPPSSSSTQGATSGRKKRSSAPLNRNLYEETVRHTNLGLDLSMRLLHKFVGRTYSSDQYVQVFVRDLGCPFLSFDGFSLINASVLHHADQIFAETCSHMTLLRAYLYSWLMTAMPLDSKDLEFLLHGTVGYLQNFYIHQIFGEEEACYRVQKSLDTAMELDKRGQGRALWQSYPESAANLRRAQWQYMASKSTVLLHLLENRLGGRDCMRKALQSLVRSNALYDTHNNSSSGNTSSQVKSSATPGGSGSYLLNSSSSSSSSSSSGGGGGGGGGDDGSGGGGPPSPRRVHGTPFFVTPDTSREPDGAALNFRPEKFFDLVARNDCISLHSLFKTLQDSAKGSLEAPDAFIAQYLRNTGALLLNVRATVDPAADGRVRHCLVHVHPHLTLPQEAGAVFPLDFKCRIMETRDDLVVEEIVPLTGKPTSLKHEISVKVRSGNKGRRPMDPKVKAEKERSKLTEQQAAKREQYEAMIVANKDSVDLARDMQCPVRMITLDPSCAFYYEAQLTVPECLLVEALYEDVDAFNTFRQVQALRSLARLGVSRDDSGNLVVTTTTAPATRLHLKTFVDCIMRSIVASKDQKKDQRMVHRSHVYVIAEAAFALATWQSLRAPLRTHQWETISSLHDLTFNGASLQEAPWLGLAALLTIIRSKFMLELVAHVHPSSAFPSASTSRRQKYVPRNLDLTDDTMVVMLGALLLAIAKVKSRNGTTPHDVAELLLVFAAHGDEREPHANKKSARADTSHFKSLLLYALSQVRVEPFKGDTRGVLRETAVIASNCIRKDFRATMISARINKDLADMDEGRTSDKAVLLAAFDCNGIVTAASLGCLVEGDMQQLQGEFTAFQESLEQRLHERLSIQPLMAGAGGVEYLKYVLRPGSSVGDAAVAQYNGCFEPLQLSGRASRASSDADVFHITTPCIRSTALEAFVRFCFMQHLLYNAKYKLQEGALKKRGVDSSAPSLQPALTPFLPVAVRTCMLVISSDTSREVRRLAAQSLRGAIEGRPARLVARYLSQAEPLNCCGWADTEGFTVDLERGYHRELRAAMRSLDGAFAAEAMKQFWDTIVDCHQDQQIRSELLAAWLYLFPKKADVPPSLAPLCSEIGGQPTATQDELDELVGLADSTPATVFDRFDSATNQLCGIKSADKPPPPKGIGLPSQPRLSMGITRSKPSAFGMASSSTSGASGSSSSSSSTSSSSSSSSGGNAFSVKPPAAASATAPATAEARPAKQPALRLSLGSNKQASTGAASTHAAPAAAGPQGGKDKKPLARKLSLTLKRPSN